MKSRRLTYLVLFRFVRHRIHVSVPTLQTQAGSSALRPGSGTPVSGSSPDRLLISSSVRLGKGRTRLDFFHRLDFQIHASESCQNRDMVVLFW